MSQSTSTDLTFRHTGEPSGIFAPLSKIEEDIISVLKRDVRMPIKSVAQIVDVSAVHASRILNRMIESGRAWPMYQHACRSADTVMAFIDISCTPQEIDDVRDRLVRHPYVLTVEAISQGRDFIATVVAPSLTVLMNEVITPLNRWPGVVESNLRIVTKLHRATYQWITSSLNKHQEAILERELKALPTIDPNFGHLTQIELDVLKLLMADPRITASEISRELDLSPSTALRTIHRLRRQEQYVPRFVINPTLTATPFIVHWFVTVPPRNLDVSVEALQNLQHVRIVASITGRANMVVIVDVAELGDIPLVERQMMALIPNIFIAESVVALYTVKRWGWPTTSTGHRLPNYISPPVW